MRENNEKDKNPKTIDFSKVYVSYQGKLCEIDDMEGITVNRIHNCIKWNSEGSIFFGFDPKHIGQAGW